MSPEYPIIKQVKTSRDMEEFIRFPLALYRTEPNYVPHLISERKRFFNTSKNPLFDFTEAALFLALDQHNQPVGRISAHINHKHNDYWDEKTGFFGFFDCIDDGKVAQSLLNKAIEWTNAKNMNSIRGPFNFSTNEECGLLIRGFERQPAIMMPYNAPYYKTHLENEGFEKLKDLFAYEYEHQGNIPDYMERFSKIVRRRHGITVRPIDKENFHAEVRNAMQIYNHAWAENWGFVPMTERQFRHMADELKPIIDPNVAIIAEKNGKPVAFSLALPDYNQILAKLNGRLLPFGWIRFLLDKRRLSHIRVITLGVVKEYRSLGIDVALYCETFRRGLAQGYRSCEMSWILEDNIQMIRALERFGAQHTKTYRIYGKKL
jgi:GNAT superfamily N-acetyltransferase